MVVYFDDFFLWFGVLLLDRLLGLSVGFKEGFNALSLSVFSAKVTVDPVTEFLLRPRLSRLLVW